jgi:hypothetical protein
MEQNQTGEENRKVRFLRFLVDLSIVSIQESDLTRQDAEEAVEDVKKAACSLFPGKEETFEIVYRPRFNRVIRERFGTAKRRNSKWKIQSAKFKMKFNLPFGLYNLHFSTGFHTGHLPGDQLPDPGEDLFFVDEQDLA